MIWVGEVGLVDAHKELSEFAKLCRAAAPWLALWLVACLLTGFAYTLSVRPEYIAAARLVVQPRVIAVDGSEDVRKLRQFDLDDRQAETELRVIRSETVARSVFNTLRLSGSAELREGGDGFWSDLFTVIHRLFAADSDADRKDQAFHQFMGRIRAMRLDLTYVIEISYRANDPVQAARVANALASAYLQDRIRNATSEQLIRSRLNDRIRSIREESALIERAVRNGTLPKDAAIDSDIRLISSAIPPLSKVYPQTKPVLLLSAVAALVFGFVGVGFRLVSITSADAQRAFLLRLDVECISLVRGKSRHGNFLWPPWRVRRVQSSTTWRLRFPQSSWAACRALLAGGLPGADRSIVVLGADRKSAESAAGAVAGLLARSKKGASIIELFHTQSSSPARMLSETAMRSDAGECFAVVTPGQTTLVKTALARPNPDGIRMALTSADLAVLVLEKHQNSLFDIQEAIRIIRGIRAHPIACFIS